MIIQVFLQVRSKNENDDILKFLNGKSVVSQYIWLGMNSANHPGTYIIDNTRPPLEINWFNWDKNSGNDSGSKNSIQMNIETGTWFRAIGKSSGNHSAAAICSKPIL